jgi:hypothetical protein
MALYLPVVILAGLKRLSVSAQVFNQSVIIGLDGILLYPRLIPVINLKTDKNTKDNNQQLDNDGGPILVFDVIAYTARQHFSSFSSK